MVRNPTPICPISVPEKMKDQSAMYPRVKVREEKDLDDHPVVCEQKRSYLLSLKDLESLILQDSSNSPERCKMVDEDNKASIRASPIPMPRAVVSSPENDLMIGKKNRKTTEKPSVLKNHNSVQSRHSQCKIIASHSGNENPISSRKSKETADSKCRYGKSGTTYRGGGGSGSFMSKKTP